MFQRIVLYRWWNDIRLENRRDFFDGQHTIDEMVANYSVNESSTIVDSGENHQIKQVLEFQSTNIVTQSSNGVWNVFSKTRRIADGWAMIIVAFMIVNDWSHNNNDFRLYLIISQTIDNDRSPMIDRNYRPSLKGTSCDQSSTIVQNSDGRRQHGPRKGYLMYPRINL